MAILYLELEDEITTAVTRVRATGEPSVALVLPAGSRIASSRINFRLLAKEAAEHGTTLAVVSPEPTARSLASAAGLPTFDSVGRYEGAMGAMASMGAAGSTGAAETPGRVPAASGPASTSPAAVDTQPATGAAPSGPPAEAPRTEASPARDAQSNEPFQADFGLVRVDSARPTAGPRTGAAVAPADVAIAPTEQPAAARLETTTPPVEAAPPDDSPTEVVPIEPLAGAAATAGGRPAESDRWVGSPRTTPPLATPPPDWTPPRPRSYLARSPRRIGVRRLGGPALIAALVLLLAFGATAVGAAYFLLPEARISVTPRIETFGPLVFQVTADPDVTQPNAAAGIVPAVWQEKTVEATETFTATGVRVHEEKASGAVTFSNRDIGGDESIPKGAVVKTGSGISFTTDKAITVPNAIVQQDNNGNLILKPGTASVGVTATAAGTGGNVSAGTITVVPKGYNKNLLKVTNPKATSGGSHTETKIVSKADYDAAVKAVGDRLQFEFDHWIGSGADAATGSLLVTESATLGDPRIDQPPDDVVGKAVDTFDLSGTADARVVAVDPKAIAKAGVDRFMATSIPTGRTLIGAAPTVAYKPVASTDPAKPRYEITASGQGYRDVDAAAIKKLVLGKPIDEARAALGSFGDASVTLRPDWFGTIPQFEWRVSVDVSVPASS